MYTYYFRQLSYVYFVSGNVLQLSQRKKCLYSELFWSIFSDIWAEYRKTRSISQYSVRMQENLDQNSSEYGHFLRSLLH